VGTQFLLNCVSLVSYVLQFVFSASFLALCSCCHRLCHVQLLNCTCCVFAVNEINYDDNVDFVKLFVPFPVVIENIAIREADGAVQRSKKREVRPHKLVDASAPS